MGSRAASGIGYLPARVDGLPNGAGGFVDGVCDPTRGFRFTDLTRES